MTEHKGSEPGVDGAVPDDDEDDDELEIVTLVDEAGNEQDYVIMDVIEVDDAEYAILIPDDAELDEGDDDEEPEALVLRVEGEELVPIDNEEELRRVASYLEQLAQEAEE